MAQIVSIDTTIAQKFSAAIDREANARLIAAAPTLLEALKDLLRDSDFDPSEPLTTEEVSRIAAAQGKAQAAIKLAEGE